MAFKKAPAVCLWRVGVAAGCLCMPCSIIVWSVLLFDNLSQGGHASTQVATDTHMTECYLFTYEHMRF